MAWTKKVDDAPRPFSSKERAEITLAQDSFAYFLRYIYPNSFREEVFRMADGKFHPFELGWIHYKWADIVQSHPRSCILAPRLHLKSTVLNTAYMFWQLFRNRVDMLNVQAAMIMSYSAPLAETHAAKLKDVILKNEYCRFWIDNNPAAKSQVDFIINFNSTEVHHCQVLPFGVLSNVRGRHPKALVLDDILSDFSNPLDPKEIKHIDNVFHQSLESLPDEGDPLVVIGTPQSYEDTLYSLRKNSEYFWARFPAEYRDKKRTLWPQKFDMARLNRTKNRVKLRAYQVEYLLQPFWSVNSFIPQDAISLIVDRELRMFSLDKPFDPSGAVGIYGGMDVGKELHPSHISIGALMPTGDIVQIYHKFLDGMKYNAQAKLVTEIVRHFQVRRFYYDATRGELDDRGLPTNVMGLKFSVPKKTALGLVFENYIFAQPDEPGLVLLHDERQNAQLVSVDRNLHSIETADGHGDAFWSNALMCRAAADGPVISLLANAQDMFAIPNGRPRLLAPA